MNPSDRWSRTWQRVASPPPDGLLEELLAAYSEPHRAYHTVQHLSECFDHLDSCPVRPDSSPSLELALWFHDAIYEPRANDNESNSAAWFRRTLHNLDASLVITTEALILITCHDSVAESDDQRLLLDIDLSILGTPTGRFEEYETQIRREFEWVPEDVYRAARTQILRQFFDRQQLFHTDHFNDLLGAQARENLGQAIETLAH